MPQSQFNKITIPVPEHTVVRVQTPGPSPIPFLRQLFHTLLPPVPTASWNPSLWITVSAKWITKNIHVSAGLSPQWMPLCKFAAYTNITPIRITLLYQAVVVCSCNLKIFLCLGRLTAHLYLNSLEQHSLKDTFLKVVENCYLWSFLCFVLHIEEYCYLWSFLCFVLRNCMLRLLNVL